MMLQSRSIALAFLAIFACASSGESQGPIRVPHALPRAVLLDGKMDPEEWEGSLDVPVAGPIRLSFLDAGGYLLVGVLTEGRAPRPVDLFVQDSSGAVHQLHASAAIGERLLADTLWTDTDPAWRWGNHVDWMANEAKVDSWRPPELLLGERMFPSDGVEFQIRRSRFSGTRWRLRVEIGTFPGTEGTFVFPATATRDPATWAVLEFG